MLKILEKKTVIVMGSYLHVGIRETYYCAFVLMSGGCSREYSAFLDVSWTISRFAIIRKPLKSDVINKRNTYTVHVSKKIFKHIDQSNTARVLFRHEEQKC